MTTIPNGLTTYIVANMVTAPTFPATLAQPCRPSFSDLIDHIVNSLLHHRLNDDNHLQFAPLASSVSIELSWYHHQPESDQ